MSDEGRNLRKFFRVAYPPELMPTFRGDGTEFLVTEVSEGGLRIRCDNRFRFRMGTEISGEIVFLDGGIVAISGIILRGDGDDFVVALIEGVPFRRIVLEQRNLLRWCPSVLRDS